MKKLLVCLANSWKTGGRCLAGLEVTEAEDGYHVMTDHAGPVWIRPISDTEHGELSKASVSHCNLLDLIEIECTDPAPIGTQSENWHFQAGSIKRLLSFDATAENLTVFVSHRGAAIFGNYASAVHDDYIHGVDHSLVLIQANGATVHTVQKPSGKNQVRMNFSHEGHAYDLPVTDPVFTNLVAQNPLILVGASAVFLTISLGLALDGFHTKLIAGVILCK